MSEIAVIRPLETIATEINVIKGQAREVILHSSVEIGRRLVEAKEQLEHGEWGKWLAESVDYSHSTANNLMSLYREYGDKIGTLGNLSYTKALALLGVPAEEREQFAADVNVENVSARELQAAIKEKNKLEKQLEKERREREALQDRFAKLEQEAAGHADRVAQLQVELADARIADNAEDVGRLQGELEQSKAELADALSKVKELEHDLKTQPIDAAVVEKVPEDVERELAELRKRVAQPASVAAIKFRVQFDGLVAGFGDLLATLDEVKSSDPDVHVKLRGAVQGLLGKMSGSLEVEPYQ